MVLENSIFLGEKHMTKTSREEIVLKNVKGNNWYYFCKRTFDIVSSFLLMICISWFILILFIIQLFATKGHPIFVDKRVGKNGKDIKVYKFRSMYYDAESNIDKYLSDEEKDIWLRERKLENDPRITPFGRFLRKTSLDELPQLWNIFNGTMSVVGPRPISKQETENFYPNELKLMLSCRPGLTGLWQVEARSNADFESGERQTLELKYFTKRGFWFDLGVIFRTIPAILKQRGAK